MYEDNLHCDAMIFTDSGLFQVMALAEAAEENRALLDEAFVRLRSATHLLVLLLSLWQGLTPDQTAILEATLLPLLQDTPQLVRTLAHTNAHRRPLTCQCLSIHLQPAR